MTEQEVFYLNDLGEISDEDRTYIQGKVDAIRGKKVDLDSRIDGVADKWKTERMTKVDLTIIRLATYEMLYDEEVPTGSPLMKLWNWQNVMVRISRRPLSMRFWQNWPEDGRT